MAFKHAARRVGGDSQGNKTIRQLRAAANALRKAERAFRVAAFDVKSDVDTLRAFNTGQREMRIARREIARGLEIADTIIDDELRPRAKLASKASTRKRLPRLAKLKAKISKGKSLTASDCKFVKRVNSFNARMSGVVKKHGATTKACVSLRNWGRKAPGCASVIRKAKKD